MNTATVKAATGFSNILFATDFSDAAAKAIPYVKGIARHYEGNIFAFHARPPAVNPMTGPNTWAYEIENAKISDEQRKRELLEIFPGGKTHVLFEEGVVLSLLQKAIKENEIDLVVLGTHGRTGMGKLLLGSEAEEILRSVDCPVLTVGPNALVSSGVAGDFREILFASDFGPESREAAKCAISLAMEFNARILLMHVVPERKAGELVSDHEATRAARELLLKMIPAEAAAYCKAEIVVERGNPAERILETAATRGADLIVLGARKETGVPGASTHLPIAMAHKVVSRAHCPVLTIHK